MCRRRIAYGTAASAASASAAALGEPGAPGPVVEAFALAPGAGRMTPPGAGWTGLCQLGCGIPARLVRPHRPDLLIAAHRQHESLLTLFQRRAQFAVRAIDFVAQHPGAGNPRIECAD